MRQTLKSRSVSLLLALAAVFLFATAAISGAAAERGKALFNDPEFAGGARACNDCHIDGRGLEGAARKDKYSGEAGERALADMVNNCIEKGLGGKPIDVGSPEMKDMIEYIKSLTPVDVGVRG